MKNNHRVAIVDDEKKICELILRLVDWEDMNLTVVGTAQDGLQAYEMILREKPDIVISDIRMPSMNGIEMIGKLKEEGCRSHFIVISGYREFEYAQSAMRYGVTDYLLKPINKTELQEALQKLTTAIATEVQSKQDEQNSAESKQSDSLLRYQFLHRLVGKSGGAQNLTLETLNRDSRFHFEDASLALVIIKADCLTPNDLSMLPFVSDRTNQVLRRTLAARCTDFETVTLGSRIYCLYQEKDVLQAEKTDVGVPQALAEEFSAVTAQYETYCLTVCTGKKAQSPALLGDALASARQAVAYRLLGDVNHIVEGEQLDVPPLSAKTLLSGSNREALINAVELGSKERIRSELSKIFSPFNKQRKNIPNLESLYALCYDILLVVQQRYGDADDSLPPLADTTLVNDAIDNARTLGGLVQAFSEAFLLWIEPYFDYMQKLVARPIRKAMAYVEENFAQLLSLDSVASEVHITPAYLSAVFKKETGTNFSEYLTTLRLREAKKLLRETDHSVAEIAEQIGYSDYRYFSKVFTKSFAISPNKYRKL